MPTPFHRIRALWSRDRMDRDLDEEMQLHLEGLVTQFREEGFNETEARRLAAIEFGAVYPMREEARDARGLRPLEELGRDIRYGVRMLRKRPLFTVVAVLSLTIGIGANAAVFSLVNAIILRELPYERPEELVDMHLQLPDLLFPVLSYPDYEDLRDATTEVFAGTLASQPALVSVDGEEGLFGELVTGDYFSVLGVDALIGRVIGPDDNRVPGGHPVVMLDYGYWQTRFGGDPDVIGRQVRIEDRAYTIIGVGPPRYAGILRGVLRPAFYAPMMMVDELMSGNLLSARDNHNVFAKARLAPGVTRVQAETEVAAVSASLSAIRPQGWDPTGTFTLVPTTDVLFSPDIDGGIRTLAWLLMIAVGLVLLVACVNLAGFLLGRALDRRREVAMRLALGASRGALIRQLLTETTLLSLLGGVGGFWLAVWLLGVAPTIDLGLPVTPNPDLAPDGTVLAFTLGISLIAGTLLGLAPALQSTHPNVATTLKGETGGGGQTGRLRWRNALVVTQLAVSMVLLVGAGLFLRSLQQQYAVNPGFRQTSTAIMTVEVPANRYSVDEGRQYVRVLLDRFRALPGVEAIGIINTLPLTAGLQWIDFTVDGYEPTDGQEMFHADRAIVDPGFFDAAGIPIMEGRAFVDADSQSGRPVVIVSAAMARRFWSDGRAVGQLVRMAGGSPALPGGSADLQVVGVARDIDWESLGEGPRLMVYVPYLQYYSPFVSFVARTSTDPGQMALAFLTASKEIDPEVSVSETTTMEQHLSSSFLPSRIVARALSLFATLVLLLAAIGLYGVVSYAVATRTREVGIRMALGADVTAIRRLLTTSGLVLVVVGSAIGLALSLAVNRLLSSLLFGVGAFDPITFAGAGLVLGVTALVAAYLPARRASRLDAVTALRAD